MDDDLKAVRQTFISESIDLLQDMEEALLSLEKNPGNMETTNALFRAAHTIKGASGIVGLENIEKFTHAVENLLSRIRDNEISLDNSISGLLLECRDHIVSLVHLAAEEEETVPMEMEEQGASLQRQLFGYLAGKGAEIYMASTISAPVEVVADDGGSGLWHISLRFGPDVLRNGMDPISILTYLKGLGEITSLTTILDSMPLAEQMDPESCYLGFELNLNTSHAKAAIEDAFEFVRDDCLIRLIPPKSQILDYVRLITELPEDAERLGEILVRGGAISKRELSEALVAQDTSRTSTEDAGQTPLGEILVQERIITPVVVDAALEKQKKSMENKTREARFIRVDSDKLDSLINMVGELVIANAGVTQHAGRIGDDSLMESVSGMSRLVEDIRERAMQVRLVPIGETFARFQRVVRDISKTSGKDIELVILGGDTELDRTVTERIGDPLMHLVRNSADHGLEMPEERLAAGKDQKGSITLKAYNDAGSIVIEVIDNGKGLNRDRIIAKAMERGIITDPSSISDREIFALVFEAGFSTAEKVTNISGRGVGMDVVRRNIEALRGFVEIESTQGVGSTVRIRLPLTLAIIDGFMVQVADSLFIIPLDMVEECLEMSEADKCIAESRQYINLRGEVLPYVRLREKFGFGRLSSGLENIVVVRYAGERVGLVVDRLQGEVQTVIKSLGQMYRSVTVFSGATILGDGTVALIVDIPHLVKQVEATAKSGRSVANG